MACPPRPRKLQPVLLEAARDGPGALQVGVTTYLFYLVTGWMLH